MPIYLEKKKEATVISEEYPDVGYLIIPKVVAIRADLTPNDKLIYALINSFTNNGQDCYASNGYIGRQLALSQRTIQTSLQKLEKMKLIERKVINRNERSLNTLVKNLGAPSATVAEVPSAKIAEPPLKKLHTNTLVYTKDYNQIDIEKKSKDDFKEYLDVFNEVVNGKYRVMSEKTTRQIKKLISIGYTIDDWRTAIAKAYKNDYLCGRGDGSSTNYLTPEYISRPEKFQKWLQDNSTKKSWFIPRPKRDGN